MAFARVYKFKKAPSNRGLRRASRYRDDLNCQFKKAPSNRGLRRRQSGQRGSQGRIQKSPIKSGIKTPRQPW